eukprot:TRINITY_DN90_c0_g1_i8.p1 TRINITY_DN90_c0_g1~~TRINITY_DN90_c0_g1_i8.p1  ORF type:complete len:240 (-),score=24.40 TRINITY_DN90_c0_g1_i8:1033-1752(-)
MVGMASKGGGSRGLFYLCFRFLSPFGGTWKDWMERKRLKREPIQFPNPSRLPRRGKGNYCYLCPLPHPPQPGRIQNAPGYQQHWGDWGDRGDRGDVDTVGGCINKNTSGGCFASDVSARRARCNVMKSRRWFHHLRTFVGGCKPPRGFLRMAKKKTQCEARGFCPLPLDKSLDVVDRRAEELPPEDESLWDEQTLVLEYSLQEWQLNSLSLVLAQLRTLQHVVSGTVLQRLTILSRTTG